ncbi:hypothetical protein ACLMJK_005760 [Lecanora helva]
MNDNEGSQQNARQSSSQKQSEQVEVEDEASGELNLWPCGYDECPIPYMEDLTTFQRQVRDGLKNLESKDVCYDHIGVLMVYWKGGDVPQLAQKAKDLGRLLEDAPYNFTVIPHEIDYQNLSREDIEDNFQASLIEINGRLLARDERTSSLFILYYGGHGAVDGQDRLWKPKKASEKYLIWSNFQQQIYRFNCDVLYLFDCCHSLAMVETLSNHSRHRQRCEILCSSGLKEPSGTQKKALVTEALRQLLAEKRDKILRKEDTIGGLTFESICDIMTTGKYRESLVAEPQWRVTAPNPAFQGRITLAKRGAGIETQASPSQPDDFDSGYESQIESRTQMSNTRILIKIRLADPAEGLSSNDWLKWFEGRPHSVAHVDIAVVKEIEWVGIFESDSSLALITVPLWLWHNMEQDPACESLGIVRSKNLLRGPRDVAAAPVLPSSFDIHA